ncbi:hypothetical protein M422DRAFT_185863, partial [Sphaerobolus stellatus SS14]
MGQSGILADIWDGSIFKNFKGADGQLFSEQREDGLHLVFAISVDWFNPYMNKAARISRSVGVISLVCLNIPPAERYKYENMYLAGIMPGPQEPKPHELDHFL